jgi:putative PIN family toxin of toxin-antitoxin system
VIRAVLDANVLVSGFAASSGTMAELIDHWRSGVFQLVTSRHIIAEVRGAWTKPYWQTRFSPVQVDRALALMEQEADVTPITARVVGIATHPEDDLVLATAVSAQVDYLVTGDERLHDVGSYQGVGIRSPRMFLDLLEREEAGEAR